MAWYWEGNHVDSLFLLLFILSFIYLFIELTDQHDFPSIDQASSKNDDKMY